MSDAPTAGDADDSDAESPDSPDSLDSLDADVIRKYPRTRHLQGSRLQPGDHDLACVRFSDIRGAYLVVEEKLDGANAGVSFGPGRTLLLQSRGHYLTGGGRERHFDLFKQWAHTHRRALWELLGERYVMYGEWLYAKHTIFYDALPHYFMEFDLRDKHNGAFLSTAQRHRRLAGGPIASVPVLWRGRAASLSALTARVGRSLYKTPAWRERLAQTLAERGLDPARQVGQTDPSDDMEGLYIKVETDGPQLGGTDANGDGDRDGGRDSERDGGVVLDRLKWVRASFLTAVVDSGSHWLSRPIVPNQLAAGVDLFAPDAPSRATRSTDQSE